MLIRVHGLSIQKEGNLPEDSEDAWAQNEEGDLIALSDGTSAAFESQWWAQTLVDRFVSVPPDFAPDAFPRWLEAPILAWNERIDSNLLPWYCSEKANQ